MKIYNIIFITTVCLLVGLCASIIIWAQPINGDLTRIGGYPERWFGWNSTQPGMPCQTSKQRTPDKKHVLVIGDSFSQSQCWQSQLDNRYTFDFMHVKDARLSQLIQKIRTEKPDAIVMETAERALPDLYGRDSLFLNASEQCIMPDRRQHPDITLDQLKARMAVMPLLPDKHRATLPDSGKRISEGFHYLKLAIKNAVRPDKRKTLVLELTTDHLFSHRRSNRLLVLAKDSALQEIPDAGDIATARCSLQKTARSLAETGIAYAILAVPDKTTAYQPYLADNAIRNRQALVDVLAVDQVNHSINMLPFIRQMLAEGQQDVYQPNDTHWSYKGHQLAAALIEAELTAQWDNAPRGSH